MKKLIFGPLVTAARRTVRLIDAFLNPCPPPSTPVSGFPRPYSIHQPLFLR